MVVLLCFSGASWVSPLDREVTILFNIVYGSATASSNRSCESLLKHLDCRYAYRYPSVFNKQFLSTSFTLKKLYPHIWNPPCYMFLCRLYSLDLVIFGSPLAPHFDLVTSLTESLVIVSCLYPHVSLTTTHCNPQSIPCTTLESLLSKNSTPYLNTCSMSWI